MYGGGKGRERRGEEKRILGLLECAEGEGGGSCVTLSSPRSIIVTHNPLFLTVLLHIFGGLFSF